MNQPHEQRDLLCGYVEGLLEDEQDIRIERHLRSCVECAAFADGYAKFLADIEDAPEDDVALQAATARLDSRMAPYLGQVPAIQTASVQDLRSAFGLIEVVQLASQRILELARERRDWSQTFSGSDVEPAFASAQGADEVSERALNGIVVVQPDGSTSTTDAKLAFPHAWPSESIDLLLEFDLRYRRWNAAVGYLIDARDTPGGATGLLLYDGPIDDEGLVEIRRRWDGPAPRTFDATSLCVCVISPARGFPFAAESSGVRHAGPDSAQ